MKQQPNYRFLKWTQMLGLLAVIILLSLSDGVLPQDPATLSWITISGSFVFLAISVVGVILYIARAQGLPIPLPLPGSRAPEHKARSNTYLLIFSTLIMAAALLLLMIGKFEVL
ncbi:MAG: hypothetical protein J2P37_23545 [Ktedonobacteraceae bacterium]|nr:hypothetical protein [Ktedonobacteraceae bacterium]MBO0792489.1 hypothetical protein [Ktedonobacteraceae bacterium]